jgi:hypothetical protein
VAQEPKIRDGRHHSCPELSRQSRQSNREPPEEVVEVHDRWPKLRERAREGSLHALVLIAVSKALRRISAIHQFKEIEPMPVTLPHRVTLRCRIPDRQEHRDLPTARLHTARQLMGVELRPPLALGREAI